MRAHISITRTVIAGTSVLALPGVAFAANDVTLGAEASVDAGYANNPFLVAGANTGSGYAEARVAPDLKILSEHSSVRLYGSVDYQRYFQHYDASESYVAGFDYLGTPNAKLKTHLNVSYDNSIVGQNLFSANSFQSGASAQPIPIGTDISLIGTRDRRQTAQVSGDVTDSLSERDTISASAYYIRTRYNLSALQGNYNGYGASAGYSRLVSAHLQIGAQGSIARYDYIGGLGTITVYSPQLSFSANLSPYWKVEGAFGASFVQSNVQGSSTSFSGNLKFCRKASRTEFCLSAQRAVLPTGLSGTQTTTILGGTYSYKLSPHGSVYADVNYNKNSLSRASVIGNAYLRGTAGYRRELTPKIQFELSGRYSEVYGQLANIKADYGAKVGIVFRLGRSR